MIKMYMDYLKAYIHSKKGQGMVEYGLIISLIAVAVIAALVILGPKIASLFNNVSNNMN
jgi:pilus assembly protein Flp/PilA